MAQIRVAREAGACYGVERALRMVEEAADRASGRVHTLGPLIHNPRVVADLAARGVDAVDAPEDAAGDVLLLRTHGTVPEEEARARELCSGVLDATCPFVKKVHQAAERLRAEGYRVVVVGERVLGGMVRTSGGDFRSNLARGGKAEAYPVDEGAAQLSLKIARLLRLDYCGIDYLFGKDGLLVCEVNSNAFFQGFEGATGVNVAGAYAEHILAKLAADGRRAER